MKWGLFSQTGNPNTTKLQPSISGNVQIEVTGKSPDTSRRVISRYKSSEILPTKVIGKSPDRGRQKILLTKVIGKSPDKVRREISRQKSLGNLSTNLHIEVYVYYDREMNYSRRSSGNLSILYNPQKFKKSWLWPKEAKFI
jgi:hypothetical protein